MRERTADESAVAGALKERVYATFTGLAIVLVLSGSAEERTPAKALSTLVIGVAGITIAGYASDVIAHLAVRREFPAGQAHREMLGAAGTALGTVVVPALAIVGAWVGLYPLASALWAAAAVYVLTLGLIGYVAVRRSRLAWWEQLLALAVLVVLALIVIALQTLAHSE